MGEVTCGSHWAGRAAGPAHGQAAQSRDSHPGLPGLRVPGEMPHR